MYEFRWANITLSIALTATSPERNIDFFVAQAGSVQVNIDQMTVEEFLTRFTSVASHPDRLASLTTGELEAATGAVMCLFGKEVVENFHRYRNLSYTGRDPNLNVA